MSARKGTIIEGLYELTDSGEDVGGEIRFVGQRLSDAARVDVRIVAPSASGVVREQFSTVAAILGRVDHPNCLSALGAGQLVDRTLYTVTEMTVAGPLTGMLGRELPDRELAEVALQLLSGLEHLHNQGILLGHVTPDGVVLGEHRGVPRLQIVDFSFARMLGRQREPVLGVSPRWLAPELCQGQAATEASDMFSAGRVLKALSSAKTGRAIVAVIDALLVTTPAYRPLASELRSWFAEFVEEASRPFSLEWLPDPELTAISSGVFELPTSHGRELIDSTPDLPVSPPIPAPADPVFEVPRRSRGGLGIGLLVAGVAAAGWVFLATSGGQDATPRSSAVSVAGFGPNNTAAPRTQAPGVEVPKAKPDGNPIVWLAQVNRTDLDAVVSLRQRRRLLSALAERPGANERVNRRWNAMLDLWQANDADRPCATFAAALATLEGSPERRTETDLIDRVVVPVPAPGSRAGVSPDHSCTGLVVAFEKFKTTPPDGRDTPTSRRRSHRRGAKRSTVASAAIP